MLEVEDRETVKREGAKRIIRILIPISKIAIRKKWILFIIELLTLDTRR
jgi:hypothetical protein